MPGFSNWLKGGSLKSVSAAIVDNDEADKLRWEEVAATLSGFSSGLVFLDFAQELQILRDRLHTRYGRFLRSGPHETAPALNTSFFKSFHELKKRASHGQGAFFNFHEKFEPFRFPGTDAVDVLNDVPRSHFACPQDPEQTGNFHARADGQAANVAPTVFRNSGQWANLQTPTPRLGEAWFATT